MVVSRSNITTRLFERNSSFFHDTLIAEALREEGTSRERAKEESVRGSKGGLKAETLWRSGSSGSDKGLDRKEKGKKERVNEKARERKRRLGSKCPIKASVHTSGPTTLLLVPFGPKGTEEGIQDRR